MRTGVVMVKRYGAVNKAAMGCVLATLLPGCGDEALPYDALPLRDTLLATPEVIAGLPLESRREIARRFDASRPADNEDTTIEAPREPAIEDFAWAADAVREAQGRDALIFGAITPKENAYVVHARNIDNDALTHVPRGPLYLQGHPHEMSADDEITALRGHAGQVLRDLSRRTHADKMVRTTNLPLGAWAKDGTLYVNASWLVAMAALEDSPLPLAGDAPISGFIEPPKPSPLTVDFNPYRLPESLLQCWNQVETTCECGTTCAHEVTDPTFSNAVEECAWVNANPINGAALCVLALLGIEDVRQCVSSGGSCTELPVSTREDAIRFLGNDACVSFLDACLQDGSVPAPPDNSSSGGGSSCNGCNGCDTDCSGFGDSCSKCNEDCAECNQNWEECNQNCKDCNQNYEDTKNCSKCSVKPRHSPNSNQGPLGAMFWFVAPMIYVLGRKPRRRSSGEREK